MDSSYCAITPPCTNAPPYIACFSDFLPDLVPYYLHNCLPCFLRGGGGSEIRLLVVLFVIVVDYIPPLRVALLCRLESWVNPAIFVDDLEVLIA